MISTEPSKPNSTTRNFSAAVQRRRFPLSLIGSSFLLVIPGFYPSELCFANLERVLKLRE